MPQDDKIDWTKLRARIAATPVILPKTKKELEQERIERKKRLAREKWRKHYIEHRDKCLAKQKAWEQAHPDKVRAKKQRFYAIHKTDSEWMEKHRRQNREYKARRRERERLANEQAKAVALAPIAESSEIMYISSI